MTIAQKFIYLTQKRSVKYGIPFLILMVAGSFGLKEFTTLRYQFSKNSELSSEEMKKYGIKKKPSEDVTLETEFEKVQSIDIDNWENKRGPRPWEETLTVGK